jgi:hypothetical protein
MVKGINILHRDMLMRAGVSTTSRRLAFHLAAKAQTGESGGSSFMGPLLST